MGRSRQACNPCKRRKIRCSGEEQCSQCARSQLKCTYKDTLPSTSRRGAAARGHVIAQCRSLASLPLSPQTDSTSSLALLVPRLMPQHPNPSWVTGLLPDFASYVYPMSPIILEAEILDLLSQMHDSHEAASFIYIFAAVTLSLACTDAVQQSVASRSRIVDLLNCSLECHKPVSLDARPTIISVITNIFTEICFNGLQRQDLGVVYLRHAVLLLDFLQLGTPEAIKAVEPGYRARSQRIYWECFIHERYTALTCYKPVHLVPLCGLPDRDPSMPIDIERGFNAIINSFRLVDREFLNFWLGNRSEVTVDWVERKQQELDDYDWHSVVGQMSLVYQADLIVTRHWLRTLTWQMALSNFLLSSTTLSPLLSLSFPLRLSNNLRQFLGSLPRTFVGIHGSGLLGKLLEIAITITDVVLHLDSTVEGETIYRIRDIIVIKDFVFSFSGAAALRPAIALTEKLQALRTKYPKIKEVELLVC